jgi:hypothetical protein
VYRVDDDSFAAQMRSPLPPLRRPQLQIFLLTTSIDRSKQPYLIWPPLNPPRMARSPHKQDFERQFQQQQYQHLAKLAADLKASGRVSNRTYRLKEYQNVFVGSEFVTSLLETKKISKGFFSWGAAEREQQDAATADTREEGVRIGQAMVRMDLIHHCLDEHDFEDAYLFYRCDATMQCIYKSPVIS